jgi:hypothetical protein
MLDRLSFLVGELTGPEQVHATPWAAAGAGVGTVSGRLALDGKALVQEQTQERDGAVAFRAVNVFMTEPANGAVLLYSFDSAGFPPDPPARGNWQGADLVLERTTGRGASRTTYTPDADGYRWSKAFRAPDASGWSPVVEGRLTEV